MEKCLGKSYKNKSRMMWKKNKGREFCLEYAGGKTGGLWVGLRVNK
jgi:hypothetical protein